QHYPKTRLPSHHLRVRGDCLIEWDGLDHRRHPTQGTETKRCVSSRGVSRQRACYLALSEYMRSTLVTSIGSGPTPRSMETPPGRRPLNVSAIVLPPEAVMTMTLAPPSACKATAGSVAALSMWW